MVNRHIKSDIFEFELLDIPCKIPLDKMNKMHPLI